MSTRTRALRLPTLLATVTTGALAVGLLTSAPAQAVVDHKPPTVAVQAPATPASGWFNQPVRIDFGASDSSGIDPASTITESGAETGTTGLDFEDGSATAVLTVTHDGTTTLSWDIADNYGNHTKGSLVIKLDATAPTISRTYPSPGLTLRQFAESKPVAAVIGDDGSGIQTYSATGDVSAGTDTVLLTKTTGDKQVVFTVSDRAGNTTTYTAGYTVTPYTRPTVSVQAVTQPNSHGWYRTPVELKIHGTPGQQGSSIAKLDWSITGGHSNAADATIVLDEPTGPIGITATDNNAISSLPVWSNEVHIDPIAPTIDADQPGEVLVGSVASPHYRCDDDSSGIDACSLSGAVNDGKLDTTTPGTRSFTVTATDLAGNTTSVQRTYTVTAPASSPGPNPGAGPVATAGASPSSTTARFVTKHHRVTAFVGVSSSAGPVTGTVTIADGSRVVGTISIVNGTGNGRLARLKKGKHVLTVTYTGSALAQSSSISAKVRVR